MNLIFLFIGMSATILIRDTVGLTNSIILSQHTENFADLWSMGVEVTTKDKLECAMYCVQNQTGCQSFSFDQQTGACRLGHCIISWPNDTSPEVLLYQVQQPLCESTPGFKVYTFGNISACLWISPDNKNFTNAALKCAAMNSNLMSLKYVEKLEILKRNASIFAYVGLDDMKSEGTFVWHDDNTVIKSDMIRKLFKSGEPNNGNGNENCARYEVVNLALNDAACADTIRYICEKLCFHW